jgi:hypothetical protein
MHERLMKLVCNMFYIDLIAPEGLEGKHHVLSCVEVAAGNLFEHVTLAFTIVYLIIYTNCE